MKTIGLGKKDMPGAPWTTAFWHAELQEGPLWGEKNGSPCPGGGGAGCRGPWRGGLCGWSMDPPRAASHWAGCVPRDLQGEARLLRAAGLLGLGLEEGWQHAEYSPLLDRVSPKLYAPFNSGQLSFEKEMHFNEHRLYNCSKCVCIHV